MKKIKTRPENDSDFTLEVVENPKAEEHYCLPVDHVAIIKSNRSRVIIRKAVEEGVRHYHDIRGRLGLRGPICDQYEAEYQKIFRWILEKHFKTKAKKKDPMEAIQFYV